MVCCVGLVTNLANKNRIENPQGFSEAGENKQLLIAIVVLSLFSILLTSYKLLGL
jgi:hypothetical protein